MVPTVSTSATPLAILCPGQGNQDASMFDLAIGDPAGAAVVEQFSATLGMDLPGRVGDGVALFDNAFAQPAIVAAAVATWAVLSAHVPRPLLFAGYSVGEVAAWACAGAWDAATAATVVAARAAAMDRHGPSGCGMLAVRGLPRAAIERHATGLHVAIVNASDHVIMAGPDAAIAVATAALDAVGAWTRRLDVRVPSHTPLLAAAADDFAAALAATPASDVPVRVLRGIDGIACRTRTEMIGALPSALCRTIRWDACCRTLSESGVRVALELGPGRSLAQLCAVDCPEIAVRSIADFRSLDGVASWLARSLDG